MLNFFLREYIIPQHTYTQSPRGISEKDRQLCEERVLGGVPGNALMGGGCSRERHTGEEGRGLFQRISSDGGVPGNIVPRGQGGAVFLRMARDIGGWRGKYVFENFLTEERAQRRNSWMKS
jgi:hypothetical protein